mmetsp:Transcript_9990/g.40496  ORF Transcript_9990/g.40496 Transcript_9990/m.40496 type:complete len:231 (-) Transcript_9990:709-1401(-)
MARSQRCVSSTSAPASTRRAVLLLLLGARSAKHSPRNVASKSIVQPAARSTVRASRPSASKMRSAPSPSNPYCWTASTTSGAALVVSSSRRVATMFAGLRAGGAEENPRRLRSTNRSQRLGRRRSLPAGVFSASSGAAAAPFGRGEDESRGAYGEASSSFSSKPPRSVFLTSPPPPPPPPKRSAENKEKPLGCCCPSVGCGRFDDDSPAEASQLAARRRAGLAHAGGASP